MKYYEAVMSGKVFPENKLHILDDIFGDGSFESWVRLGALSHVENVSVIDFLKDNNRVEATRLYKDIHGCDLSTAYKQVKRIEADMARFSKK